MCELLPYIEMPDPLPQSELSGQLERSVRLPDTHRSDDETLAAQGQMHRFADAFRTQASWSGLDHQRDA